MVYIPGRRVRILWWYRCLPFLGYSCRIRVF